ncbi:MAG: xylulose kinase, partial [Deltaproteobacteria bacterium]|nr:xylulose kinase [Deltaproteobacteria bacterium]
EQIVGICCDSQYFLTVPVNEHAEPLMNAVSWMDTRGGKYNRELMKGFPAVQGMSLRKLIKFIRYTGVAPTNVGADALAHMLAIKNELPEIYEKTYKFLEPSDYLTARFSGKISASQHTALTMMLTSNRQWGEREYCEPLLKLSGLDREKLPELLPSDGIVGKISPSVATELGLSNDTQVICGMFDNQAAIAGAGIVDIQEGLLLVSTTLSINGYVNSKKTDIISSIASIPSCLPGKYMLLCEQGLGGKCLEYHLKNVVCHDDILNLTDMPEDAYERLNKMAAEVPPGSDNVMFLPWLNGAYAPSENRNARGGFFNLSLETNRCHLTRAVMEGVAFNSRAAIGTVEKFRGNKYDSLRFAGGGALSDIWAQSYADILQIPIHQMEDPVQVTCRGAGLFGLVRLGHLTLDEIPKRVKIKKTYEPIEANRATYDKLFEQFRAIFKNNQKVFNSLNG